MAETVPVAVAQTGGGSAAEPNANRLTSIDAVRGFALLGILFVNIHFFGNPLGESLTPGPPAGGSTLDLAAWWFTSTLCTGKFYPLFSMLFGAGLAIQFTRAQTRGEGFWTRPARRLAALSLIGLVHGLLIWYGDVLFMYSLVGFGLLLAVRLKVRWLLAGIAGLGLVGLAFCALAVLMGSLANQAAMDAGNAASAAGSTTVRTPLSPGTPSDGAAEGGGDGDPGDGVEPDGVEPDGVGPGSTDAGGAGMGGTAPGGTERDRTGAGTEPDPAGTGEATTPEPVRTPLQRLLKGFSEGQVSDPSSPLWQEAETEAFRDGPFSQATALRAFNFLAGLVFFGFSGGWQLLALFLTGAVLVKSGVLAPGSTTARTWGLRFVLLGLCVGLPASVAHTALIENTSGLLGFVSLVCLFYGGPCLSLGYLGVGVLLLHDRAGRPPAVAGLLASAGRAAMSCYLLSSVTATFIFYHWGLGLFGSLSYATRTAMVPVIFIGIAVLAHLWLSRFRFGPMEWLWRTVTYLKPQPMARRADAAGE
ncbi:MAG: DUF418 domain-containing protein [Planctomycetaceae bacterium]|jgi:uncharacterized protein|nr:DUF418 domain-containing protein [Planctomycetaceae bacterium]